MVNTNKKAPIYINQDLIDLYKQAGIDPATGRPLREEDICNLKAKMMNLLSVKDLQTAIHRYKWYNLPSGLTTEDLERMLYYKHKVSIFYSRINEKMYILPFALSGDIDCYGKYCGITPVCLGSTEDGKSKAWYENLANSSYANNKEYEADMKAFRKMQADEIAKNGYYTDSQGVKVYAKSLTDKPQKGSEHE